MDGRPDDRSQPIFRVPRDKTPAELVLDDGERSYVLLYVAPGDTIGRMFQGDSAFIPVTNGAGTRFVMRKAIACITTSAVIARVEDELPQERQQVVVRLRGGTVVRGELRWTAPSDRRRTLDHLNDSETHLLVYETTYVHYIAKTAILSVEESDPC